MKSTYLIIMFLFSLSSWSQDTITIGTDDFAGKAIKSGSETVEINVSQQITKFTLKYTLANNNKLKITGPNEEVKFYEQSDEIQQIEFEESIIDQQITIILLNNDNSELDKKWSLKFILKLNSATEDDDQIQDDDDDDETPDMDYDTYISNNYKLDKKFITPFGIIDEEKRIHIFIDNMGNNLLTTIPQGISNAQYIVHILYPYYPNATNETLYSIKQRSGSFNSNLNFRNSDIKNDFTPESIIKPSGIRERQFLLSTSSDNISFDLIASSQSGKKVSKKVIENFNINMSPTYHGSFDIGLVQTELRKPTFSLVNSPNGEYQTVKMTDPGKTEGTVTLMATFYYSPIIILEDLFGKEEIPFYKKNGRNFLDDHKIYERIYPTIGVGLKDKVFENLYYGLNWEVVRGLAIFYGWNYGKVNTFTMPDFQDGITPVTTDEFNYYKGKQWKTAQAYGIKLDLLVFMGLFGQAE